MTKAQRPGTRWVVVQMLLLAAVGATAPASGGHWPTLVSVAPGALLFLFAAWTGLAGVRDLGPHRTPSPVPRPESTLVTTGIYARLRHPLYASMMAMGFGWALLWSSPAGMVLAAILAVFLDAKARHEERLLCRHFPNYSQYMRRVPRYLPRPPA